MTGERLYLHDDPELGVTACTNKRAVYRHKQRYETCGLLYRGRVLHLGCGSGYGREIIDRNPAVKEVISVDRDPQAIAYATKHYGHVKGWALEGDVTDADNMEQIRIMGPWDTIVMVELFEHLGKVDQDTLLDRCYEMLVPGGKIILSTPLAQESGPNPDNPHHLWEWEEDELCEYLCDNFPGQWQMWSAGSHLMTDGHAHDIAFVVAG